MKLKGGNFLYLFSYAVSDNSLSYNLATLSIGSDTANSSLNFIARIESDYYYMTHDFTTQDLIYLHVHNVTTGAQIIARKRTTTFSSEISSLQIYTTSIAWIGVKSVSNSYSELIRYDRANDNFTIYQITGSSLSSQYIYDSSGDTWYALSTTQYSYFAPLANISDITALSVTNLQNSGFDQDTGISFLTLSLDNANISTSFVNQTISVSDLGFSVTCDPVEATNTTTTNNTSTNTTSTNSTSTNTTSTNTTNTTNEDSSGLSTSDYIFISLGAVVFVSMVVVIAVVSCIYFKKKAKRRMDRVAQIEQPEQVDSSHECVQEN